MNEYAAELLRMFLERVDELDNHLRELRGKYSEGARPGFASALQLLEHYPDHLRSRARRQWEQAEGRADLAADGLVTLTKDLLSRESTIGTWFDASDNVRIPRVLVDEVRRACKRLDMGVRQPVLAVAGPTEFETYVGDLREQLFANSDVPEPAGLGNDRFVLITVPRREAASPRWWPIVLGHELAHLKLDAIARSMVTHRRDQSDSHDPATLTDKDPQDDAQRFGTARTDPLSSLRLRTRFPWSEMAEAIRREEMDPLDDDLNAPGLEEPDDEQDAGPSGRVAAGATDAYDAHVAARYKIADNWLNELVCDAYMVYRYGPASVAAMASYLWATGSGDRSSGTHPSGALRVSFMLELLGNAVTEEPIYEMVLSPWSQAMNAWSSDVQPIGTDLPEWQQLIWGVLWNMRSDIEQLVAKWDQTSAYDSSSIQRRSAVLLAQRQLSIGLPPYDARPGDFPPGRAESDDEARVVSAEHVELIDEDCVNAAWAVAIADDREPLDHDHLIPVDRLTLKSADTRALVGPTRLGLAKVPPVPEFEPDKGVLTKSAIERRLQGSRPIWERLVVTPLIQDALGTAAIDVRLAPRFVTFQRSGTTAFRAASADDPRSVQRLVEKGWREQFVLHPGELVLAATLEYVALPRDLSAQVITRSSYGRLGLITATAVQVHPYYRGCLTLELVNLGSVPIALTPGERIAQLVFTVAHPRLDEPIGRALFMGKYVCPTEPEFSLVAADKDLEALPGFRGGKESI